MTANFGCGEGRTMASQPSVHNEERNLLRLRAWEQRNQEASQAKELNPENVPLFGEPYKTNKGDELSNRIQKMLGSYENVNSPYPLTAEPLPTPSYVTFSQSDQGQPDMDKSTRAPFHNQVHYTSTQTQKGPSSSSYSSQLATMSTASSPNQHRHSSTLPKFSLNQSQGSQPGNPAHQQKKSEAFSDFGERDGLPQEMSAHSPDAKPQSFLHSSNDNSTDADTRDTFDRNQRLESSDRPSESAMDVSTLNMKPSPKDASLTQATKTNALPSQTFPPLLSSKQSSVVMTQKPTAYVRPMDGQDQVVSDSPELKPSPEPYVPLPELISKSNQGKMKILPPFLETRTNEAQCVEDILREMIHSWPPLLTAIHTPSIDEPSKSSFSAKEAEHVSSRQGQQSCISSPLPPPPPPPTDPSQLNQQSSLSSFEAAHSSGVESASSSDSESSSRSESDSESATGEPPEPPVSSTVKTEPDAPAVSRGDWQLGNWIRSSQQNASTESQGGAHVSESPTRRRLLPTQSSKHSSVEVVDPARESKPRLASRQKELGDNIAKPQQCKKGHQDNCYQQSNQISPSTDFRKLSCKKISSKPAKGGCPDQNEAAVSVKCKEVVATRDKDVCFTDRPKVKTKTRKKSKDGDSQQDGKRTSKHAPLDKRKLGSEPDVKLVLSGQCPSCGVKHPNPCSCPARSPAQPDQSSPDPPVRINCSKPEAEAACQKGTEKPRRTTRKGSEETEPTAKVSLDLRPPRSLLVKIDLILLSRVPPASGNHQEMPGNAKRAAAAVEPGGGGSDGPAAHKHSRGSKKSKAPNVELDNKTLPRKKRRLENKNTSSAPASIKLESSSNPAEDREGKKAKKTPASATPKDSAKDSASHKRCPAESSRDTVKGKDSCKHKRRSVKHTEHPQSEKKPPKSFPTVPSSSQSNKDVLINRPLLRLEDRQYPVKHYIKEAKKLKHKADAESDKLIKAFNYLDAAMFFVESGIAMAKDPQISMSSYTMFEETVELLKFVLKLKNSVEPSAAPSEKDFLALCLKCQSLLQMTMFRHKHKTALKYSKTLTEHFTNSAQATHDPSVCTAKAAHTPSPMPDVPSPANTSTSSGPGSNQSGGGSAAGPAGGTVAVPRAVAQVASSYVNITTLFVSAHDLWEQAAVLANKGSGLLAALDTVMGPLSPTSTMNAMVRYTRQGVHWLRLDTRKVK
ncbi:AF4/FMR2 family member 1 isoform X2 [Scophthalmus maximus]|uniref:AF4/FMR2 family member 1 isoform X2 n=1 Tax=Scophthalmus maximus TaxID=52904 RepID=UPI001FA8C99A|nr:AF4/FMR2 family member 1 isoform X2 [Scophthalmus maximus]